MDKRFDEKNPNGEQTVYDQLQTVEQLAQEFVSAVRQEKSPSIEDYAVAYPKIAAQIRELFPTILKMEEARNQSLTKRKDGRVSKGPDEIRQLGDFQVIREIGRGGMGIVYEAEQQSLGRRVALKILPKNSFSENQLEQFERESRLAARLHHTNIVPVYGVGQQSGFNYYVMQLIVGQNLGEFVQSKNLRDDDSVFESKSDPLTLRQVCEIGRQVAMALDYAHRQGILHRDVKPSNMILDSQENVWITDFGLAIVQDPGASMENSETSIPGTLRYMPPEKMAGLPDSPASDVYSLGISLIELLTGKPAFDFSVRTELIDRLKNGVLDEFPRQTPEELTAILKKTVAVDPNDRYPTAADLADDLENFLEHRPVSCHQSSTVQKSMRWAKRNPALAIMSGAFAVLLIAASLISSIGFVRAQAALASEKQHRNRAEDATRVATGSLNRIFSRFAPDSLFSEAPGDVNLTQPILSDEVVAMLQDLLVFYQQLASNDSDDPELGYRAALAQCRVGEINEKLGYYQLAADSYHKALTDLDKLKDSGLKKNFTLQNAKIFNQLGFVHEMVGDIGLSKTFHKNAIAELNLIDSSAVKSDLETDLLKALELARAHYFLGHQIRPGFNSTSLPPVSFRMDSGIQSRALNPDFTQLDKAIWILESVESDSPHIDSAKRHLLAMCYREYANDMWQQRNELDIQSELKSIELLEQLVEEYPRETVYRFELMKTLAEINVFEPDIELRTLESASSALERAIRIGEQLVDTRPDIASFRVSLVHAYFKQATIFERMSRLTDKDQARSLTNDAESFYRKALLAQEYLSRKYSDRPGYRVWQARFLLSLANCANLADREELRARLIGEAIGTLVNLPPELKLNPQVKALRQEANPMIQ